MTKTFNAIIHATSPAPAIDGFMFERGVQLGPHLIEEWARGDEMVFRSCVRGADGWVPETVSSPVSRGNARR